MFILSTIVDTVRIPPSMFASPTLVGVHLEMDRKYPNRVVMDVGLVVCRYGDALRVGDGVCVAGDGGAHHEVVSRFVVFRPFVDEVCVGVISSSSEDGIRVSIGFFDDIFIPAYWMLRPSRYESDIGLWVWTPDYGEEEEEDQEDHDGDDDDNDKTHKKEGGVEEEVLEDGNNEDGDAEQKTPAVPPVKADPDATHADDDGDDDDEEDMMEVEQDGGPAKNGNKNENENAGRGGGKHEDEEENEEEGEEEANRYVMEIGSEIRFKVKAINFTQVMKTAKGYQARTTTTSTAHPTMPAPDPTIDGGGAAGAAAAAADGGAGNFPPPVRKRSTSVDFSESSELPASMHITASICEDGLGLLSWWAAPDDDEEDGEEGDEGGGEAEEEEGEDG